MSYQVGTGCYGTVTQAAQVSASSQIGAVVSHGGTGYIVDACRYRYAVAWMVTQAIFEARAYGWPFSFLFQRP